MMPEELFLVINTLRAHKEFRNLRISSTEGNVNHEA